MDFKNLTFTCAVPETLWIEDMILEVVNKLPAKLFDELKPWGSIITQYPFIHKFTIAKAMETIYKARNERTILNEPLFPTDYRDSEDNLKQFIERRPIRIMIAGDTNSSFYELSHLLAKDFNTFNVTPMQLVNQEIIQKTQIGKWLQEILTSGKGIPTWVVMKLLERELDKEIYVTKGFILTGFPIISSLITTFGDRYIYKDDVAYDLKSKFIARDFVLPDLDVKEDEVLKNCVQRQLDFIYNLCCRPDFIIYLDTHHYTKQFAESIENFQKFILFYFRENVIRIDCRIGIDAILCSIRNRFKYINFKMNYECFVMNECQRETMNFEELRDTETVLPNYKWWISKFGRICPVNLKLGRLRLCDCKYPVRYLRNIFVCYSQDNRKLFIQNPAKYMHIVPKCRIAVIGPHRTGKTTLSQYLARFLKADIYRNHIQTSEIVNPLDLTEELEDLSKYLLRENLNFKQNKIEEWTTCVFNILNDIMSKILNEEKGKLRFDLFTSRNADNSFRNMQANSITDNLAKQIGIEHLVFQNSFENITSADFLSWVQSKSKSELIYKQYIIDSAPLDIDFWTDLLNQDQLPDCVFCMKLKSVEKLFDIYTFKHNKSCVNEKYIYDTLCSKFIDFKNISNNSNFEVPYPTHNINLEYLQTSCSALIEKRYTDALKFFEKYEEVQTFLQAYNVQCIDVDISNQTWTQSILNALIEYMSIYQSKALSTYDFFENESVESCSSNSSSLNITLKEESSGSNSTYPIYNTDYGSCLDWCPIALNNQNILKKGNALYSAEYKNRIYTMHSKADLKEFILNPMVYSRMQFAVPPPRIFILGLNHKNKTMFAENLASSLNVECISYKQTPTTPFSVFVNEHFSIQQLRESYNKIKHQFLVDLSGDYNKGIVLIGFPFLVEQFNDLIQQNLYPECVLIFDDEEEMTKTFHRYFARLHMMKAMSNTLMDANKISSPDFRASSITSYIESLPENEKHDIEIKCFLLMQLFQHEILKMEEECLKLGISILKVPKNYKLSKEVYSFVECINNYRHRIALFENVKEITMDESELLLNSGYYRFSRFKYSCPVDVCRLMTLNQFEGLRMQGKVYPCVYLDFIYFVCGKKNLKDFKRNPLEFINTCNPPQLQDPIRIAVFGPSKSGVSTICHTIANEFGFKILSPKDLRHESDSAIIDLLKMEKSSTPNGIVLDNFHLTPKLLQEAAISTVDISVVFIVVSSFEKVLENWFMQNRNLKTYSNVSLTKLHTIFCKTLKAINCLRVSNATSLLNIHYIDGDTNSWTMWDKVKNEIIKTTRCITSYKIKLIKNRCANLGYLNMFYDSMIFKREINHFYCQACLSLGKLKAFKYFYVNVGPAFYTDKCQNLLCRPYGYTNENVYKNFNFSKPFEANEIIEPITTQTKNVMCMFQYIHIFYWTCNDHTINFMLNTQQYYNDSEKLKPLYVPFLVIGYTKEFVAYQGFCPVEYKHGQFVKGAFNLSVYYRRKVYLLSNIVNVHEFLTFPEKYSNIKFDTCSQSRKIGIFRGLSEDMISNTVHEVSTLRPKHFALDGRLSATTFIALKLNCLNSSVRYSDLWVRLIRNFTKDCKKLHEEIKKYHQNSDRFIVRHNSNEANI